MQPWLEQIKVALTSSHAPNFEQFAQNRLWATLPAVEREQIAHELSQEAVRFLDHPGDQKATRLFDLALSIAPVSAKILLVQGVALYQKAANCRHLPWAQRAFERLNKAVEYTSHVGMEHIWLVKSQLLAYELDGNSALLEQAMQRWLSLPISGIDTSYETQRQAIGGRLHYFMGKLSGEPSDFQQAVVLLRKAIVHLPTSCELQIELGHSLFALARSLGRKNLMQEAIECFEKVLERSELDRSILIELAQGMSELYTQTGCRHLARKAKSAFERAFEISSASLQETDAYAAITLLLAELEPDAVSLKTFFSLTRTFKQENARIQLLEWHGKWLQANHQENIRQLRELKRELESAADYHSNEAHYWMLRGVCAMSCAHYFRDNNELILATEHFQKGLVIDHDRPGLWLHLARAYLLHSEMQSEVESAKKAAQLFAMAVACGRYSELFWMDWAIAFFRIADATGDRGALSEALVRFEKAIEMIQQEGLATNYKLFYLYGCALDFLGDMNRDEECYEKAVQLLQAVIQAQPFNEEAKCALAIALTHLGESSSQLEHLEKANQIFAYLCDQDHEDDYIWNEWGVCLLSLARVQKEQGGSLVDSSSDTNDWIDEAIARLQRSYHLGNSHALYNLCCAFTLKGDFNRAMNYLKQALEVGIHPPVEDMIEDEWLEPLRGIEGFRELLDEYTKPESESSSPDPDLGDDLLSS